MQKAIPERTIGLFGAIVTIVGFVVGASIYILPGAIAAEAGPGVVLSYFFAGVLALFSCVVAAQVGVVFPKSGASFVVIGRLVSPFLGFICVWMMIGAAAVAIALLGFGFADYAQAWLPGVDRKLIGCLAIIALTALNLAGVRETVSAQYAMVAAFAAALLIFSAAGLLKADAENFVPFLPNGFEPALAGAAPAFFSYAGFMIVLELGGEIKNPGRNIPAALGASFLAVLAIYSLTSLALVGLVPWQSLSGVDAPIAAAAKLALPAPLASFVAFTALAATVSSINVMLLGYSRDIYMLSRGGIFPELFARTIGREHVPIGGVLTIAAIAMVAFAFGATITDYANFVVVGLLLLQIGLGVAAMMLPRMTEFQSLRGTFRMPVAVLCFFSIGLIVLSASFLLMTMRGSPAAVGFSAAFLGVGVLYYLWRDAALAKTDKPLKRRLVEALGE